MEKEIRDMSIYTYKLKDRRYFEVPAEQLAPWLIGKVLCFRDREGFVIKGRIWETEAYRACDRSADANRGSGGRAQLMSGGHLHYHGGRGPRLDIVAGKEGILSSVLIRGIDPYGSHPSNSVEAMGITSDLGSGLDGVDLLSEGSKPRKDRLIWLEDDGVISEIYDPRPRMGLSEKDEHREDLLRFRVKSFTFKCE